MTNTWIGNSTGTSFWDNDNNWSPNGAPATSSDVVSITESGSYQVVIQNADPSYTVRSLVLGGTGSSPTLDVLGQLNVQKVITIAGGGTLAIGSSGTANASRVVLGSDATVVDQGTLNISGVFSGSGSISLNGADLFANSIAGTNTYTLSNSATMTLSQSVSSSGAVIFGDGTPDTLNLDSAGSSFGAAISGFGGGDMIDIGSLGYSNNYTVQYSDSTLTIGNGATTLFTFTDIDDPGAVVLANDGVGGTLIETCFLAGTHILTDQGEVSIEQLVAGDMVATVLDGTIVYKPIKWVGGRRLDRTTVKRSESYPVRILTSAFSDMTPHCDLLVTPEHCIFVDGCLIPARMLVNGCSIVEDRSIDAYSFHHIEFETHVLVLAEGLITESYLDTGNRGSFSDPAIVTLHPRLADKAVAKTWAANACAPMTTNREIVESIWRMLRERALGLGLPDQQSPVSLVDDPQLHLQLDNGSRISARWSGKARYIFHIPDGTKPIQLLSRTAVPADVVGPFVDDRRKLGVAVKSVVFWDGLQDTTIDAKDIDLAGWYAAEDEVRWTDGNAVLELPTAVGSDAFVEIVVVGTLLYRQEELGELLVA